MLARFNAALEGDELVKNDSAGKVVDKVSINTLQIYPPSKWADKKK